MKLAPTTPHGTPKRRFHLLLLTLLLVAGLGAVWRFGLPAPNREARSAGDTAAVSPAIAATPPGTNATPNGVPERLQALTESLRASLTPAPGNADARLAEQLALADQRAALMRELMARDPGQALAASLSFADYAELPAAVQRRVERPFSVKGNFSVFPVCPNGTQPPVTAGTGAGAETYSAQAEGVTEAWPSFVLSRRGGIGSKVGIPLQGFELQGQAALRDEVMQVLDARNAQAAREAFGMTVANPDAARDFLTGEPITTEPVTAAAGGRLFLFANEANAGRLNAELAQMEASPGPHTGSQVLLQAKSLDPAEAGKGFDLPSAWVGLLRGVKDWTDTKKRIYIIRVDFADLTGAVETQAAAEANFNFGVSNQVFQMSYGKTWSEAVASPMVVRMPGGTNTYRPSNNDLLHNDAKAAFNALGTGVNLASFDIVCVAFKSFGISSGGITYAGLAGGDRMWLQGSFSVGVNVHELGHNYGLGHAHSWNTTDGSVVGTGSREEYGDIFDNMGNGALPAGHWHPQGKSRLNWLTAAQWTDATAAGTYRIYRIDHMSTTPSFSRGVRVRKSVAPAEYYWVGYRRAFTTSPSLNQGAYLIREVVSSSTCDLLDTTPGTAGGKNDAAVLIGRTYSDAAANVHLTPLANGGSGADEWLDLAVKFGPFPGNRAPTASVGGPTTLAARTSGTYTATAADADGDALAYFWDFGDGVPAINAAAVTHTWSVGGNYTVRVTVSDMKGLTVTQTLAVTVTDPLQQWTARTSGTTADLNDVCAGTNGGGTPILLAVGTENSFDGKVCTSPNGTNWTVTGWAEVNTNLKGVIYDGRRFIACGESYSFNPNGWIGGIWTSTDGATWTRRYTGGLATTMHAVASSGSTAVAVGQDGRILYSTNGGTNWTAATSTAANDFFGVAWGAGRFVAVGNPYEPGQVFTSPNGTIWTDTTAGAGLLDWQRLAKVRYCNDRFLASGWYTKIRHSTDLGATFQTTRASTEETPGLAFGNGVFLAAGINKDSADADINLVSTDGAFWTPMTTAAQSDRNAAVFFKGTFLTVGEGGSIWQSGPITAPSGAGLPTATTLAATSVTRTSATLNGSAIPNGSATVGFFQWGTTTGYGQSTAPANLGTGAIAVALSAPLAGLTGGVTYHFRAVSSNSVGIAYGTDATLLTPLTVIELAGSALAGEACPPGNSVLDPGEGVTVNFTLTNRGSAPTVNLTATLLAVDGVTAPSAPQNFGVLVGGGAAATRAFTFTASGACGGTVTTRLQLNDGAENLGIATVTYPLGVPRVPLVQSFDGVAAPALPPGWTVTWTGAGAAWATTVAASDSAPNAAFVPNATAISDNSLVSPSFNLATPSARLTFRHRYQTEATYDGGVLELSLNGGAFTDLVTAGGAFTTNGYNQALQAGDNPLSGRQAWSGTSGGFITTSANLPANVAGNAVRLRWRFGSDSSVGETGWYVDTIALSDGAACCTNSGPTAPTIVTLAATAVTNTAATLNGSANPNGSAAISFFQWGTTTNLGQRTASVHLGNGTAAVALATPISGLTAGVTYYFRAAASNSVGVIYGSRLSFTTRVTPVVPTVTTLAATTVTNTAATLNGSANPNGFAAIGFFQWGTTTNLGQTTASVNLGSGTATAALATPISGLTAGVTYYFRAAASNSAGVIYGSRLSFTTPNPTAAPTVTTVAASAVTKNSATLNGSANPKGLAATGFFQWGITTGYGQTTTPVYLGNGTAAVALSAPLTWLTAGVTYHFRAAASNSVGVVYGNDMTFTPPVTFAPPISMFTGGDAGDGLDFQGTFPYAVNVGGNGAPGLIGNANFTTDTAPGVSLTAPGGAITTTDAWAAPNLGATVNDDRLELAMRSIRFTTAPAKLTVTLGNLQAGRSYKLQLLFIEQCCDRVFDVKVNGSTVAPAFRLLDFGPFGTPLAVTHTFAANGTSAVIELGGGSVPAGRDGNPTLSAFTLEDLGLANPNTLAITRVGANVIVSWPAAVRGVMQQSTNLVPAIWTYSPSGATNPITLPASGPAKFYRLILSPTNDTFASRTLLSGTPLSGSASNAGATKEAGEPAHVANSGGRSLWWSWTAPANGSVTVTLAGSNFDTLLAVYTGTAVNGLTQVAANDDYDGNLYSRVTFTATQGVTYQIAMDGYNDGTGAAAGTIQWNLTMP